MKTCSKCHFLKGDESFYLRSDTGKLSNRCKDCKVQYEKDYRFSNSVDLSKKRRNRGLLSRYGISEEQYQEMFLKQNGCCGICDKPALSGERLHVDHDHRTGKVRGLLCFVCNMGIGYLRDCPASLLRAAKYLDGKIDEIISVEGYVVASLRERGKLVPGGLREGWNIWTNTGREFIAMLMSLQAGSTKFRADNVAYIGVGTGTQTEDPGVLQLITPAAYSTGQFLASLDVPATFPLSPSRTTVRYHRTFLETEITLTGGSRVDVTEIGLFTDGSPASGYTPGTRDRTLANANAQAPVAYKSFDALGKTDSMQLELTWDIRL